jgi:hypothetical protein
MSVCGSTAVRQAAELQHKDREWLPDEPVGARVKPESVVSLLDRMPAEPKLRDPHRRIRGELVELALAMPAAVFQERQQTFVDHVLCSALG